MTQRRASVGVTIRAVRRQRADIQSEEEQSEVRYGGSQVPQIGTPPGHQGHCRKSNRFFDFCFNPNFPHYRGFYFVGIRLLFKGISVFVFNDHLNETEHFWHRQASVDARQKHKLTRGKKKEKKNHKSINGKQ